MLEKIHQHSKGWLSYVIVGLICIPFALWGIGDYLGYTTPPTVASVNGEDIYQREFLQVYQQIRSQGPFSGQMNPADETALKQQILEELITQKIQKKAVNELGFYLPDSSIHRMVTSEPSFQQDGKFSRTLFEQWLRNSNSTEPQFIEKIRGALLQQQLQHLYQATAFTTPYETERLHQLINQKRDILFAVIDKEQFQHQLNLSEDTIQAYYKDNQAQFSTEELVKIEYIELTEHNLPNKLSVSNEELKKHFEEHSSQQITPERRQVAHILLPKQSNSKAAGIKQRLAAGESFGKLAKEFSEDAATKNSEGVLGWFTKEELPAEIAAPAFALKEVGAVSAPIESGYGIHLVKLLDKQTPKAPTFDKVSTALRTQLEQEKLTTLLAEKRETLAHLSYEHPDSLDKAAEALELSIKESNTFSRQQTSGLFNHPKVLAAAFGDEVLRQGLNSEVIEIGPKHWVVLRNKAHTPSQVRPFEEVKSHIKAFVTNQELSKLAKDQAEKLTQQLNQIALTNNQLDENKLAELSKPLNLSWEKQQKITRDGRTLSPAIQTLAFELPNPEQKLQFGRTTAEAGDQVIVVALKAYAPTDAQSAHEQTVYQQHLENFWAQSDYQLFLVDLKSKAKIKKKLESL